MQPISIYLHIPYCQAKCPYCDFNSYAATSWPEAAYVDALRRELRTYAAQPQWQGAPVQSIFFGGGTPSLFAPASIGAVLQEINDLWALQADAEATVEANPGTVDVENLSGLRATGINRISFGVQSFLAHHLERLGRIHDADQARCAVRAARRAGFDNINIDLIYALPHQTLAEWQHDLDEALALGTDHVSAYNLTYEEGTAFHQWRAQGKLKPLAEELEIAMFHLTRERLQDAGLMQYEISNYAKAGRQCRHNLNYWHSGAYVGVGAGAHGYAAAREVDGQTMGDTSPAASTNYGERWGNERSPGRYMQLVAQRGESRVSEEALAAEQARGEFVFLALRCRSGFAAADFEARFATPVQQAFPHMRELQSGGLIDFAQGRWSLTERGLLLADSVFATFL